jgi:very-short-patch-repair endonuclease
MNTEQFINKAIEVHGDKYDYSKIVYKNTICKVIIICKEHGEFLQQAGSHLRKHGCKKCSTIKTANKQRSNNEKFIEKAKELHGDTYDYSKVDYINSTEKVIIVCKVHGEFLQNAKGHIQKKAGCQKCGIIKLRNYFKDTNDIFIKKAIKIHGDIYDYTKVNYGNNGREPITIICKKHGEFNQKPQEHLSGYGCSKCGMVYRKTTIEYIEKAKAVHGDKYDYSKTEFTTAKEKIIITCKKHGDFEQEAYCHSIGVGCPRCVNKTEGKLYNKIKEMFPSLITQFRKEWCRKTVCLPFDFCIQEDKIIIELDGEQHFNQVMDWKTPQEQFDNDKFKEECANNNGYSVIRLLQHDVFYDTYDWVKELCDSIEEIKTNEGITNIYLCKNNEYTNY